MTDTAVPVDERPLGDSFGLERARALLEPAGVGVFGFLVVALVAGSTGGFLPTTQGWAAVLTLWLAAVAFLVRERGTPSIPALLLGGGLLAFTAWTALSAAFWSASPTSSMLEVLRNASYLGIVAAGIAVTSRRTTVALLGGVLAAVWLLSLYALGTRLLPDRFGEFDSSAYGYRLAAPIT